MRTSSGVAPFLHVFVCSSFCPLFFVVVAVVAVVFFVPAEGAVAGCQPLLQILLRFISSDAINSAGWDQNRRSGDSSQAVTPLLRACCQTVRSWSILKRGNNEMSIDDRAWIRAKFAVQPRGWEIYDWLLSGGGNEGIISFIRLHSRIPNGAGRQQTEAEIKNPTLIEVFDQSGKLYCVGYTHTHTHPNTCQISGVRRSSSRLFSRRRDV